MPKKGALVVPAPAQQGQQAGAFLTNSSQPSRVSYLARGPDACSAPHLTRLYRLQHPCQASIRLYESLYRLGSVGLSVLWRALKTSRLTGVGSLEPCWSTVVIYFLSCLYNKQTQEKVAAD